MKADESFFFFFPHSNGFLDFFLLMQGRSMVNETHAGLLLFFLLTVEDPKLDSR